MSNSSIWPIYKTLSGATYPFQTGTENDDNKAVLRIPQSPCINWSSLSDCSMPYPVHLLGGGAYLSAEIQSAYSTAPVVRAVYIFIINVLKEIIPRF